MKRTKSYEVALMYIYAKRSLYIVYACNKYSLYISKTRKYGH